MKRIVIDMADRTERHLLSGRVYQVDGRLERQAQAIYLDRTFVNHPAIAAIRSVLLPDLHLWVIFFEGGANPYPCRCYMHVARILDRGQEITVEDLYLDVLVAQDGGWQVVDVDEFRTAVAGGELSQEQLLAALEGLEHACKIVDGADGDVESYLQKLQIRTAG